MNDRYHIAKLENEIINTVYGLVKNIPRPFGVFLSGGFDSGLLAALTKPDFVFTVRFNKGPKYDESWYADAIIDYLRLRSRTIVVEVGKSDFEENAEAAIKAYGKPITHFSLVPFYILTKVAANHFKSLGCEPHVLSGEGPDEYLGGYARYIIFDRLQRLYEEPELINYTETIDRVLKDNPLVKYMEFMGYTGARVDELTTTDKLSKMDAYPFLGKLGAMDMWLGEIEKMEQAMAKANGLHLHYPYIEPSFQEYCFRLPDNLKVRDGVTKWAFREVCKKYLPQEVWNRSKMGGPVAPINHWLGGAESEFSKEVWIQYQNKVLTKQ